MKTKILRSRKAHPIGIIWNGLSETSLATLSYHGARLSRMWYWFNEGYYQAFYDLEDWEQVGEIVSQRLLTDSCYLPQVRLDQDKAAKLLLGFVERLNEGLTDFSVEDLLQLYKQLFQLWVAYDEMIVLPWFVGGDFFQQKVLSLTTDFAPSLTDSEINLLITSPKKSFSAEEELAILKVVKKRKQNQIIDKDIQELVKRYFWIPFGYDGPTKYDYQYYQKLVNKWAELSDEAIEKKIQFYEDYEENISRQQKHLFAEKGFSPQLQAYWHTIHQLSYLTDERKVVHFQANVQFASILEALAKRLAIEPIILRYVTFEELCLLKDNPQELEKIASPRQELSIFTFVPDKMEIIVGEEAQKLIEELRAGNPQGQTLQGQVASKGETVLSTAKVLSSPSEQGKINKGDILVASMTTPEYVPAMRLAAAIITDEGGITCHAAIMARELNIPTVIGTKIATKLLRDGMLVEVRANHGVVRILS